MSDQPPQQSRPRRRGRGRGRGSQPGNRQGLWRPVPAPDDPTPIVPAADPAAFIRSIESPPLRGGQMAEHYMAAVVERAAGLASALAASVDLLAAPRD
jgi:hypothetical protein